MSDQELDASWVVAGEYDARETYTRATDSRGHKDSHRISMPPHLWERACALVGEGRIPGYDSPAAFIRDAMVHRLHYWSENQVDVSDWPAHWAVTWLAVKAGERLQHIQQLRELPGAHRETLELAFSEGLYDMVIENIMELREKAKSVPSPFSAELIKMASDYEDKISAVQGRVKGSTE